MAAKGHCKHGEFIGEIRKASDVGYKSAHKVIWLACIYCGKERWVKLRNGLPGSLRCLRCAYKLNPPDCKGVKNSSWRGGRHKGSRGYILIWLSPDDFFYSMASKQGYVLEHRLVVAKALGRCLHSWEVVHHKEGCAKDDNRYPETLQLVSDDRHKQITILENKVRRLEGKVKLLQWQIREQSKVIGENRW